MLIQALFVTLLRTHKNIYFLQFSERHLIFLNIDEENLNFVDYWCFGVKISDLVEGSWFKNGIMATIAFEVYKTIKK